MLTVPPSSGLVNYSSQWRCVRWFQARSYLFSIAIDVLCLRFIRNGNNNILIAFIFSHFQPIYHRRVYRCRAEALNLTAGFFFGFLLLWLLCLLLFDFIFVSIGVFISYTFGCYSISIRHKERTNNNNNNGNSPYIRWSRLFNWNIEKYDEKRRKQNHHFSLQINNINVLHFQIYVCGIIYGPFFASFVLLWHLVVVVVFLFLVKLGSSLLLAPTAVQSTSLTTSINSSHQLQFASFTFSSCNSIT